MVMHSGNHEIIGIRHRETQTLYISHLIEPHACSNPAYGKIQVGIYIAAIQETIDRVRQDIAGEKRGRDPSANISLKNEANEPNPDRDHTDHSPGRPTRSNKRGRGAGRKGKRQGRYGGNGRHHASGKVIDEQVCILSHRFTKPVVDLNIFTGASGQRSQTKQSLPPFLLWHL
jgi:hypothetical protein